jgi:hypothetical protein
MKNSDKWQKSHKYLGLNQKRAPHTQAVSFFGIQSIPA